MQWVSIQGSWVIKKQLSKVSHFFSCFRITPPLGERQYLNVYVIHLIHLKTLDMEEKI